MKNFKSKPVYASEGGDGMLSFDSFYEGESIGLSLENRNTIVTGYFNAKQLQNIANACIKASKKLKK